MLARHIPQGSFHDSFIDDDVLLGLLRQQDELKGAVRLSRSLRRRIKEKALPYLDGVPLRCGEFLLEANVIPGRPVNFETQTHRELRVKKVDRDREGATA